MMYALGLVMPNSPQSEFIVTTPFVQCGAGFSTIQKNAALTSFACLNMVGSKVAAMTVHSGIVSRSMTPGLRAVVFTHCVKVV